MTIRDLAKHLKEGNIVCLNMADAGPRTAHRIADTLETTLGVHLGRLPYVDKPWLMVWIPGLAPHPLDRRLSQEASHARP